MTGFVGEIRFDGKPVDRDLYHSLGESFIFPGHRSELYTNTDGICLIVGSDCISDPSIGPYDLSAQPTPVLAMEGDTIDRSALQDALVDSMIRGKSPVEHVLAGLRGGFAIAAYQPSAGLLLARDPLGRFPLYLAEQADRVIFATSAQLLKDHSQVDCAIDPEGLLEYLSFGYTVPPRTLRVGVKQLPPGCCRWFASIGQVGPGKTYWTLPVSDGKASGEQLREQLGGVIRHQLAGQCVDGVLVDGGFSAALLAAGISRQVGGVKTFSLNVPGRHDRRREPIERLIRSCGANHRGLDYRPDPQALLEAIRSRTELPAGDPSILDTLSIAQVLRRAGVSLLVGDGGEELFARSGRYRSMQAAETMHPLAFMGCRIGATLVRPIAGLSGSRGLMRFIRLADGLNEPPAMRYFSYCRLFSPEDLLQLVHTDFLGDHELDVYGPADRFCDRYQIGQWSNEAFNSRRMDLADRIPNSLLTSRAIFCLYPAMVDPGLIQTALQLPTEKLWPMKQNDAFLAALFSDWLPADLLSARSVRPSVPLANWLRDDLQEVMVENLTDRYFLEQGFFEPAAIAGLLNDHLSRRADHSRLLWNLLMFAMFHVEQ